jgi:hypothetical protein
MFTLPGIISILRVLHLFVELYSFFAALQIIFFFPEIKYLETVKVVGHYFGVFICRERAKKMLNPSFLFYYKFPHLYF